MCVPEGTYMLHRVISLAEDHPSYTTTSMWFWGWSYNRGSTVHRESEINPQLFVMVNDALTEGVRKEVLESIMLQTVWSCVEVMQWSAQHCFMGQMRGQHRKDKWIGWRWMNGGWCDGCVESRKKRWNQKRTCVMSSKSRTSDTEDDRERGKVLRAH